MPWRERLSHAVFGSGQSQSLKESPLQSDKEELQDDSKRKLAEEIIAEDDGRAESSLTTIPQHSNSVVASASPITMQRPEIRIDTGLEDVASDVEENGSKLQEGSIPSSTSRRKNLAAILSSLKSSGPALGTERNAADRPPLRSKRTNSMDVGRQGASSIASSSTDGSKSPSIGSSIKSLHERHKLHREAGETFKNMKADEDQDSSRYSTDRSERANNTVRSGSSNTLSSTSLRPVNIPDELLQGEAMLKVTTKKVMQRVLRLDSDRGQIVWDSKKNNKINLEAIREVRTNDAAASYRTSMSISPSHESRWISIIYQTEGVYKALHLIALSDQSFQRWKETLSAVQDERRVLMSGADLLNQKQQLWLRQHWKTADSSENSRLEFEEVVKLCRRLGILSNGTDLASRFREADSRDKGYLTFEDFQQFVSSLKRRIEVEILFLQWADLGNEGGLSWASNSNDDVDIEAIRDTLQSATSEALISPSRLAAFITQEQKIPTPTSDAVSDVIKRYDEGTTGEKMGYAGFLSFLLSGDNAIMSDQSSLLKTNADGHTQSRESAQTAEALIALSSQERTQQDMTRPLSEYYISSSHNTYLVGGQWKGDSTVEGYIRALLQGARSVEIDCWDGPNGEPQVTHGRTLTSKVSFREVITAIERYAFIASPFPLILSLEVHNDLVQQDTLAEILRSILGSKLLAEPLEEIKSDQLPSPEQIKGKILVKAKNLLVADASSAAINANEEVLPVLVAEKRTNTSATDTTESESSDHLLHSARTLVRSITKRSKSTQRSESETSSSKKILISPRLASLLIYTVGVKHRGINKKEFYAVEHMISLSERSGLKYLKGESTTDDLIKHNRTHLTRVYPSMSSFKRLNQSANFIPNLFWSMGCQLVAINWQTLDVGYEMNQAMFARNAKSGYVLKPEALRVKDVAKGVSSFKARVQVQFKVRIISAQQLPRFRDSCRDKETDKEDVIDPFVSLCAIVPQHRDYDVRSVRLTKKKRRTGIQSLFSAKEEQDGEDPMACQIATSKGTSWMNRQRTSVVQANGFNPIWNETLSFVVSLNLSSDASHSYNDDASTSDLIREATKGLLNVCFLRFEVGEEVKLSSISSSTSHSSLGVNTSTLDGSGFTDKKDATSTSDDEKERDDSTKLDSIEDDTNCLATYMISLGSLEQGYRHVPLYDAQLSQYLFSTLFVKTEMRLIHSDKE